MSRDEWEQHPGHATDSIPVPYRAIAFDYDGTLASRARPDNGVLDALSDARRMGMRLLLVTGRIMSELRHDFPDVDTWFDAVVAENGAVLVRSGVSRVLGRPVSCELARAVTGSGTHVRTGEALLACDAAHATVVLEQIRRLGLDCQLVYNRDALMVLPSGVCKGSGLLVALDELGISRHDTIAVGDAENDHSMFDQCELGVAVANAVASLKRRADIVLDEPDGDGVVNLIRRVTFPSGRRPQPARWAVTVGIDDANALVTLPAAGANILISGSSKTGKSYLGGLFAEGIISLGYSALIIDFEGDHAGLADLTDVLVVGGVHRLPDPAEITNVLQKGVATVVVDLSLLSHENQDDYAEQLIDEVNRHRRATGLPHWLILDEAHRPFAPQRSTRPELSVAGNCFITWRPTHLPPDVLNAIDIVVVLGGRESTNEVDDACIRFIADWLPDLWSDPVWPPMSDDGGQQGVVFDRGTSIARRIDLLPRQTAHVRHWHKYAEATLPAAGWFHLRDIRGDPTGEVACNVSQLHRLLSCAPDLVIAHHAGRNDLSEWARQVLQDASLERAFREAERLHAEMGDTSATRDHLLSAIAERYAE
jgi:hydroxymethylpyrimidine pyrophosphatase-like HAD family hydrolase